MKSYTQLQKEFDQKVKELQKRCPHQKSEWLFSCWAPGHFDDYIVKMCNFCHKTLKKKKPSKEELSQMMGIG